MCHLASARRRCFGSIPGRRLRGAGGSQHPSRLDRGHLDRSHQWCHYRGQSAPFPSRSAARVLDAGDFERALGLVKQSRSSISREATTHAICSTSLARGCAVVAGAAGFFSPRQSSPGCTPSGAPKPRASTKPNLKSTLERLVDFDRINAGDDALQRRRRERAHRQFRLLRQPNAYDPTRARHGERIASAGLSRG